MFKEIKDELWAFDAEWVPDPNAGRLLYDLPDDLPDREVMDEMWKRNGATEEDPEPYLKTVLCRLVSIAMVIRIRNPSTNEVTLDLRSRPKDPTLIEDCEEAAILDKFLGSIEQRSPQLVGYNSSGADLPILIQRAIVNGVRAPGFCARPNKPWEGRDYFARDNQWHIDLMSAASPRWNTAPSLNEIATLSGIPGKLGFDGSRTADAWLQGDIERIVKYNEHDALTTYLLWLRMAHVAGLIPPQTYREEQDQLRALLVERSSDPDHEHLGKYLTEWDRLRDRLASS